MKTETKKRELIKSILIFPENLEFIAKNGIINGTLLTEIERVMEVYASQSQPAISEEEINEKPYLHKYPSTDGRTFINLDGSVNWKKYATALDRYIVNIIAKFLIQKDGAEEKKRLLNEEVARIANRRDDGCWNCSVKDCKIFSSGKKCGNWKCMPFMPLA